MKMFWAWVCGALFGQAMLALDVGGFHPGQFTLSVWIVIVAMAAAHFALLTSTHPRERGRRNEHR